ncbi:hypothetical protein E4U43_000943 [Claviceps pusilla]|uniref:AAA+ ATPase domain-containing protein n=1 Tax=Claviceps pusilla TaxID=123648 RepID=A0A9P7N8X6_9HYPO|nr:hypothetical protein E4U43_000943 [Claviceps pusilla]
MESSQATVTVNNRHQESSQRISDTMKRNGGKSSVDQSICLQNSSESASKTKQDLSNRGSAKCKAPLKTSKRGIFRRKTRPQRRSRGNHLNGNRDISSSDSESSSSSGSDDSSSSETDDDANFSASDEDKNHGKRRSRRSRKSRSVSVQRVDKSSNTLPRSHRTFRGIDDGPVIVHREASCHVDKTSCKCSDVTTQEDMANSRLAQLELKCSQLKHQMDSLGGTTQTNRLFTLQQQPFLSTLQPVFSTFGSSSGTPYTTADLAHREYHSIPQTNHKGLKPSPSLSTHPCHLPPMPFPALPDSPGSEPSDTGSQDDHSTGGKSESRRRTQNEVKLGYKRVDAVWDSKLYRFKLQPTAKVTSDKKYDGYLFHVRRTFDSDGKYRTSYIDIKSQLLRECLQDVIGNVRGVNLVEECPKLDPNLLFLYLEDLRSFLKILKELEPAGKHRRERRRNQRRLGKKRKELKVLIKYLDKDYAKVKGSLYPMLDSGIISFEYLWALWKPSTLVYSTKYDQAEDARVFRVDIAVLQDTIFQGNFYVVEGKYLEFDGKRFGFGSVAEEIPEFQGTRKITSLPFYPLSYHKDESKVRQTLIERGKKFVSLSGTHLKDYSGLAYQLRKKGNMTKFHIQKSRIMVDPAIFRRINPNYFVSTVRGKDADADSESDSSDDDDGCLEYFPNHGINLMPTALQGELGTGSKPSPLQPLPTTSGSTVQGVQSTDSSTEGKVAETPNEDSVAEEIFAFTDDDYLIASPVVLGFSFSEKQWLEFSVARIGEVKWNEDAWASLVLPSETKDLIKALVKSRKYNLAQTTDDVIQGKGKGLVSVLHGPPGTGKTLTAEGISELLQCPLYMASAGELGTLPKYLETELQKILDICHSWGAILLLDEADVFLEKRSMLDIHRNALVSIFLRQLEYFQGILFLTTNRVETFDEAFQSRIHIALRYDGLDTKAKKAIFKMFIERVKAHGQLAVEAFTDEDFTQLAKHDLNGREIKNTIGSAQDLALSKAEAFSMRHIQQVLNIHVKFGRDLRGGTGYEDAMRSYC